MPEWLKLLLMAHGSLGLADTLQSIIKQPIQYQRIAGDKSGLAGRTKGLTIGLTPMFDKEFDTKGLYRTKDYVPVDSTQKFGDYVLAHEAGHAITHSDAGIDLSQYLDKPPETDKENEQLADDFQ